MRKLSFSLAAPVGAFLLTLVVSTIALMAFGSSPTEAYGDMLRHASKLETQVDILNRATPFYLSAVAAAIGFRMNLFNIGVEGQYLMGFLFAAQVGGLVSLPQVLHILVIMLTAMIVSSLYAGLAGILKTTRGVNEVISTIMLNAIAVGGLIAWLQQEWQAELGENFSSTELGTEPIDESGLLPTINGLLELVTREVGQGKELTGMFLVAVLVGVAYYVLLNRTRFGFDLRASGINPFAARAGGVPPRRMVLAAMMLSGAVAGLIGMVELADRKFPPDPIQGLGFQTAVALLGRNNPGGMAFAALLFAFLDVSSGYSTDRAASREIAVIMQGIVLLTAVAAYGVANRFRDDEARPPKGWCRARWCRHDLDPHPHASLGRWALYAALGVFLLTLVQTISDAERLTQVATAARCRASPCRSSCRSVASLERAGVVNIGLEGMLILGMWFGAWGSINYGAWWGLAIGIGGGMIGGLLHAIATVTFQVDHIISGVAINILALRSRDICPRRSGNPPPRHRASARSGLGRPLPRRRHHSGGITRLAAHHQPMGDLVSLRCRSALSSSAGTSWVIIALALVPITAFVIWRTRFGLGLRICGESRRPVSPGHQHHPLQVHRRDHVRRPRRPRRRLHLHGAVGAVPGWQLRRSRLHRSRRADLRQWRPGGVLLGALLFGYVFGLDLRDLDGTASHAMLLVNAIAFTAVGIWAFTRKNRTDAILAAVLGFGALFWWIVADTVPSWWSNTLPYVVVLSCWSSSPSDCACRWSRTAVPQGRNPIMLSPSSWQHSSAAGFSSFPRVASVATNCGPRRGALRDRPRRWGGPHRLRYVRAGARRRRVVSRL